MDRSNSHLASSLSIYQNEIKVMNDAVIFVFKAHSVQANGMWFRTQSQCPYSFQICSDTKSCNHKLFFMLFRVMVFCKCFSNCGRVLVKKIQFCALVILYRQCSYFSCPLTTDFCRAQAALECTLLTFTFFLRSS